MGIVRKTGIYSWLAAMMIIASCSVQEHYHTLSFFFDGVPDPDAITLTGADSMSLAFDSTTTFALAAKPQLIVHQPYREKNCKSCHDQRSMGNLTGPEPGLCYQCHTRLETMYNFNHGPAAGGYCTKCHDPHRTKVENLLLQTGKKLCLQCHNMEEVSQSIFHNVSEETDCIACHNPHGGANQSMLKLGACYQCHENFAKNYMVVHGPVAADMCSSCHTSHQEGAENHLIQADQDLCFYCHDEERIFKNENHPRIENTFCIECHNPHASGQRIITH